MLNLAFDFIVKQRVFIRIIASVALKILNHSAALIRLYRHQSRCENLNCPLAKAPRSHKAAARLGSATHCYLMTFKSRTKFTDLAVRLSDAIPSRARLCPFKILFR